jgi:hypothetical protein
MGELSIVANSCRAPQPLPLQPASSGEFQRERRRVREMQPVLQERFLANALRWLTSGV